MGIITAVSATGLAAGLVFSGTAGASASNADITLPSGGVLAQKVTNYCHRVPNLIERADKAQARIDGGVGTQGSLAWLRAKRAKAAANQRPVVVRRLDAVIARRTQRLRKLPTVLSDLAQAQGECSSLDLPVPSSVPSSVPGLTSPSTSTSGASS